MKGLCFIICLYLKSGLHIIHSGHVFYLQIEKNRGDKGGFGPLQSMGSGRIENSFSDLSISSSGTGFGSGSGFGLTSDVDSFATKPKGWLS